MGDRIVVRLTDGERFSPDFYGHWCGLRAIKAMNEVVREAESNGLNSLFCNFLMEVMEYRKHPYSFYLYNHGEAEGSADWDNYSWTFNVVDNTWRTTVPELGDKDLTIDEAEEYVKKYRPCLYRTCKCEDYGSDHCALSFNEKMKQRASQ